jgi:hypothetical protein
MSKTRNLKENEKKKILTVYFIIRQFISIGLSSFIN